MSQISSSPRRFYLFVASLLLASLTIYAYTTPSTIDSVHDMFSSAGVHDTSHRHEHIILQAALPAHHVPTASNNKRLIIIGDIHGMDKALVKLLDKVKYSPATDHIIATGDMVSKGPDSPGVITRLMALNASAVRGNHEDDVIRAWHDAKTARDEDRRSLAVVRSLHRSHLKWLAALPVILTAEPLPLYVVHAGLVPGVPLRKQDPWAVMHMRTIEHPHSELRIRDEDEDSDLLVTEDLWNNDEDEDAKERSATSDDEELDEELDEDDTTEDPESDFSIHRSTAIPVDGRTGEKWSRAWNRHQKTLRKHHRHTVVYGHDAKKGYQQRKYTYGLDSGCVTGGHLTALIVEGDESRRGGFKTKTKRVSCKHL